VFIYDLLSCMFSNMFEGLLFFGLFILIGLCWYIPWIKKSFNFGKKKSGYVKIFVPVVLYFCFYLYSEIEATCRYSKEATKAIGSSVSIGWPVFMRNHFYNNGDFYDFREYELSEASMAEFKAPTDRFLFMYSQFYGDGKELKWSLIAHDSKFLMHLDYFWNMKSDREKKVIAQIKEARENPDNYFAGFRSSDDRYCKKYLFDIKNRRLFVSINRN